MFDKEVTLFLQTLYSVAATESYKTNHFDFTPVCQKDNLRRVEMFDTSVSECIKPFSHYQFTALYSIEFDYNTVLD